MNALCPALRDLRGEPSGLVIERGTIADYDALARFHYRAGRPATRVLILRAGAGDERAGVLVVSMPTLNGAWRGVAWPGGYGTGDRRLDAARLNAEVRTISRVVIDPRFRGLGLATRMVRAYLGAPLTIRTEALAAMGVASPFFARAGMTEHRLPPNRRDAHLSRALEREGTTALDLLHGRGLSRGLVTALRTWADAAGHTRPLKHASARRLALAAGLGLCAPRIAYTLEKSRISVVGGSGRPAPESQTSNLESRISNFEFRISNLKSELHPPPRGNP